MERLEPLIQEAFSNSLTSDKKNFLIDLGRSTAERNLQEAKTIFDRVIRGEEKGAVTPEEIEYHCGTQYLEQERKALKAIEELTRDFASAVAGQVFGKVKDKSSPLSQNAVRSLRGAASSLCWTEKKLRKWVMDLAISRAKAHFGRSYWVTIDHNLRHAKERLKAPPGSDRAALTDALYGHSISFADLMMRGELSSPS
ncbi:MAG: hypothetical protein D6808_06180 [Candidatus Dadabacteria bacterium]|nr:MAG: hypothetical protein D6808_06180 [Candidatus Dadabacteria bacterium]